MISLGARTLFVKEVRRFLRVPGQTVLAPLVTTCLYIAVFGYALGGAERHVGGIAYLDFMLPGLVMLGLIANSFLNTASSVMIMKLQGTIVDLLVAPLTHAEVAGAMIAAAAVRGIMVGGLTWIAGVVVAGSFHVAHPLWAIAFFLVTATLFAALGFVAGIWADKLEQMNALPTFVITPLTFLGGVFYDVRLLPGALAVASRVNPIFYLVDGLRYGLVGTSAGSPAVALAFLLVTTALALAAGHTALRTGWKLRT